MHIGEAARNTGLSMDTIRFYESRGLLGRLPRSPGGFRQYSGGDLNALQFVRRMHGLGFSLNEIKELAALRDSSAHACSSVRDLLAGKLQVVRAQLRELKNLERSLRQSLQDCRRQLKNGRAATTPCPVLEGSCRPRRRGR